WQIVLLPSRAVCTAALCLRSCALQGSALAFEERAVSTKKIARILFSYFAWSFVCKLPPKKPSAKPKVPTLLPL
ncbi:MAG: hypothetical protein H9847_03520, partial [Candidatus Anaerobiospirillum pullicola]|nr:hypothetical protein [Candidatus Anaerobiospirillum pullicola]